MAEDPQVVDNMGGRKTKGEEVGQRRNLGCGVEIPTCE